MKLIKSLKEKQFCLKKLSDNTNTNEEKVTNHENFDTNDKLFFILNIGNYEYSKNKAYIIDEIEYKLENRENVNDISLFIKNFIKISFGVLIDEAKLNDWIKNTYKHKILSINKKKL